VEEDDEEEEEEDDEEEERWVDGRTDIQVDRFKKTPVQPVHSLHIFCLDCPVYVQQWHSAEFMLTFTLVCHCEGAVHPPGN
jgi:hypothetical protein